MDAPTCRHCGNVCQHCATLAILREASVRLTVKVAYSLDEAAVALSLSRTTVKELVRRGELRARQQGRRVLISREALEEWANNGQVGSELEQRYGGLR